MKPFVICHMCTTIDGKILSNRWGKLPGGQGAGGLFETTAAQFGVGAWLVGTTTMKEFSGRGIRLPAGGPKILPVDVPPTGNSPCACKDVAALTD